MEALLVRHPERGAYQQTGFSNRLKPLVNAPQPARSGLKGRAGRLSTIAGTR
jgi:hypothetical protein